MDPRRSFRAQPWRPLFQVACLSTSVAIVGDALLLAASARMALLERGLRLALEGPLGPLLPIAAAMGVGALGVAIGERWRWPRIALNAGSLWALVLCLILGLLAKTLLFPSVLVQLSSLTAAGLMAGVFSYGRPYWR